MGVPGLGALTGGGTNTGSSIDAAVDAAIGKITAATAQAINRSSDLAAAGTRVKGEAEAAKNFKEGAANNTV